MKVINKNTVAEIAIEKNSKGVEGNPVVNTFEGSMFDNLRSYDGSLVRKVEIPNKNAVEDFENLRRRVMNAAEAPSQDALDTVFAKFFLDISRIAGTLGDLTGQVALERVDFNLPETVNVRDIIPYLGYMGKVSGAGDPVNLIQPALANVDTFSLSIRATGFKTSLKNILFNPFYSNEKVIDAAARAYIDMRNDEWMGPIAAATFSGAQAQAYVSTGDTQAEKDYATLVAGIKTLRALKDPWTKKGIRVPKISLLCNSQDTFRLANVVAGIGASTKGLAIPLPVSSIIEFDGGDADGLEVNGKKVSLPGVTAGACYLYVPGVMLVGTKRPLTLEEGGGRATELSQKEMAWYGVQGAYTKQFLGGAGGGTAGTGYIVKVALS